jgi:hypothetical protein
MQRQNSINPYYKYISGPGYTGELLTCYQAVRSVKQALLHSGTVYGVLRDADALHFANPQRITSFLTFAERSYEFRTIVAPNTRPAALLSHAFHIERASAPRPFGPLDITATYQVSRLIMEVLGKEETSVIIKELMAAGQDVVTREGGYYTSPCPTLPVEQILLHSEYHDLKRKDLGLE